MISASHAKRGIDESFTRLKFGLIGRGSFAVPGADVLADVAAKDLVSHALAQFFGNGAALFDGEIRDAFVGVELVGRDNRVGRAGFDAASAGPAAVGRGKIWREFERGDDHAEKKPRANLLIDDAGVLADPAHAGVLGIDALDDRAGVDVGAGFNDSIHRVSDADSLSLVFHFAQPAQDRIVIILAAPGVAGNPSMAGIVDVPSNKDAQCCS